MDNNLKEKLNDAESIGFMQKAKLFVSGSLLTLLCGGCFGTWRVAYKQRIIGEVQGRTEAGQNEYKSEKEKYDEKGIEAYEPIAKKLGIEKLVNHPDKAEPAVFSEEELAKRKAEYDNFNKSLAEKTQEMLKVRLGDDPETGYPIHNLPYSLEELQEFNRLVCKTASDFRKYNKLLEKSIPDLDEFESNYFSELGFKGEEKVSFVRLQAKIAKKLMDYHIREATKIYVTDKKGDYVLDDEGNKKEVKPEDKYAHYLGAAYCALASNDMESFDQIYLMIGADKLRKKEVVQAANIDKVADWYKGTWIYQAARDKWAKDRSRAKRYMWLTIGVGIGISAASGGGSSSGSSPAFGGGQGSGGPGGN